MKLVEGWKVKYVYIKTNNNQVYAVYACSGSSFGQSSLFMKPQTTSRHIDAMINSYILLRTITSISYNYQTPILITHVRILANLRIICHFASKLFGITQR